jgi:hypothetical protein
LPCSQYDSMAIKPADYQRVELARDLIAITDNARVREKKTMFGSNQWLMEGGA